MKYLLIVDAVLAASGAALLVPMSFLCLIYGLMVLGYFPDALPSMRGAFPRVVVITLGSLALALAGGAATFGVWKRRNWQWAAQTVLAAVLVGLALVVPGQLQSQ